MSISGRFGRERAMTLESDAGAGSSSPLLPTVVELSSLQCNAMHLTAVSSYVWPVREISCSVSDACLQSASSTIIYLSMPHSTPISSIRPQQMCFIASKQEFWSFTSSQNVECEIRFSEIHNAVWQWLWKSVHCHSRRGNNYYENLSNGTKEGWQGGLKRAAQKCGASKSSGAGRDSDFTEVLPGNGLCEATIQLEDFLFTSTSLWLRLYTQTKNMFS